MHVAANCNADCVKQILTLSPDINARDTIGRTALHYACRAGKSDTFEALIEDEDCDVDAVTKAGVTPLMSAVESGDINLLALCLNERLNPFFKDALGRTALDYSQSFRDVEGYNMKVSIDVAMKQWEDQMSPEELE